METLLNENFTGSDGTNVDGFNGLTVKSDAGGSETGLQIQSNRASKTTNGGCYLYKDLGAMPTKKYGKMTYSRYSGAGLRIIGVLVLGSTDVSNSTNFLNNGAIMYLYRSDSFYPTTYVWVYDGATLVASVSSGFTATGADVIMEFTINADGSGEAKATQGVDVKSVTWGARTWTKGTGVYSGIHFSHSGNDGTGQNTKPQADDLLIQKEGASSAFTPKVVVF